MARAVLGVLLALGAVLVGILVTPSSAPAGATIRGDANCDGAITANDAVVVLTIEAGLGFGIPACSYAHANHDGWIDSKDAALILQIVAGLWPPEVLGNCPPRGCPTSTPCPVEGCYPPQSTSTPCPSDPCPTSTPRPTRTPTPTPPASLLGARFSMGIDVDGDGLDDCSTRVLDSSTCIVIEGVPFRLNVRLDRLPANLPGYVGFDVVARYSGVDLIGEPDANVWPDCGFEAIKTAIPDLLALACAIGVKKGEPGLAPPSSYTGLIGTAQFKASCGESFISLLHGIGYTVLADEQYLSHLEARTGEETLTIVCASA